MKKLLLTSILSVVMCISLIAGATFALFTSESKVNIAVTSGTVNVTATIDQNSVETKKLGADYTAGANNMFEGVANFDQDGLALSKFMPGDGIKFNIVVKNNSDVTIKYRTIIICENDNGLFSGLEMKIGSDEKYNGVSYVAKWATLDVGSADAIIPVVVELPKEAGNVYQGKTCTISYKVEAVQGNAETQDPADNTFYIYTSNDLKALSGYVAKSATTVELCSDVDMTDKEMQAIIVGAKSAVTFNGNNHTISNIKIGAALANGMTGAGNEVAGLFDVSENSGSTLTVNDLTIKNADVACSGYAGVIVGYAQSSNDVITLNNVDVIGATVVSDSVAAYVGYTVGTLTMEDCDVSNIVLTGEVGRPEKVGAFVGTANTASCVVTLTNCTNNTEFAYAGRVINGATMTIDGWNYITTASALSTLLKGSANEVNVILGDGTYNNVLSASNKTINIKGGKGAVIAITASLSSSHDHIGLDGCNVTLDGVSVLFEDGGYYTAYINNPTMTYKNCTITGQFYIYGDTSFIGCTFDNDDEAAKTGYRYIYIYDGDVLVDNCDFYTQGHGLIMYKDQGVDHTLTVKNSCFHGGAGRKAGDVANQNTAAIEINGACGANYTLNLEGTNTFDEGFSGLWRIKAMKDGFTTTVNGTAYTGTASNVYLDGVKYYKDANKNVYAYDGEYILANSATGLQNLLNAGFTKIRLASDVVGNVTVEQAENVNVEIDGNNYKYNGCINIDGKSACYATTGLTIKNINFEADAEDFSEDACIRLGDSTSATRYVSNVKVVGCTFNAVGKVAIKSYTGGDKYLTIDNCIVKSASHSLLQVANVEEGLVITNCKVYSENGINLNSTPSLVMNGCEFDVTGYAVRFGVNGSPAVAGNFDLRNNTLSADCNDGDSVIIIRGTASNSTFDLTGTTITGIREISGIVDGETTIIK